MENEKVKKLDEDLTGERTAKSAIVAIIFAIVAFSALITVAVLYIIHELKDFA